MNAAHEPTDASRLCDYLRRYCAGQENALPIPRLAAALGIPARRLQRIAQEATLAHELIGTSCGDPPGLFWIRSQAEAEAVATQLRSRALPMLERAYAIEAAYREAGQLRMSA